MMRRAPGHGVPSSHGPPAVGPGQVSNITNSNDFISKDSRVFVGNLNTFVLSKEDVDGIFRRYGIVTGISMHKGYAFVQFGHPGEARRAVGFEDGHIYAGQALDLNVVSEPKSRAPHKRNAGPGSGMHDSSRRPPMQSSPVVPPAAKRPRQDSNPSLQRSNLVTLANSGKPQGINRPRLQPRPTPYTAASKMASAAVKRATATVSKSASNANTSVSPATDVLICGVCKMQFTSLHSLAQHKKVPCRLRMSCQCQTNPPKQQEDKEPSQLDCASCDARFDNAWALCQHCQDEHNLDIFKTKAGGKMDANSGDKNSKGEEEDAGAKKADSKTTTPVKK